MFESLPGALGKTMTATNPRTYEAESIREHNQTAHADGVISVTPASIDVSTTPEGAY